MFRELHRDRLESLERPIDDGAILDVAPASPRDRDRRLAVDIARRVRLLQRALARNRRGLKIQVDLQLPSDLLLLRAVLELDRHERVELAALGVSGDERVAVDARELGRRHAVDRAELGQVGRDKPLIRDLDLNEIVDVALLELVRVDERRRRASAASDGVAFDLQ